MSQVTINSAKHIICKTLKRKYTKCNKQQWLPFCHSTEVESGELERSPLCFFLYPGGTISKSTSAKNSLLHVPLTAPPLCAGTGYSLRFFSVEQSLIFLNTQDMCLQCLTGSRILSTEQGSRNVDTQSNHPSTYVDLLQCNMGCYFYIQDRGAHIPEEESHRMDMGLWPLLSQMYRVS